MPKRSSTEDVNEIAFRIVQEATRERDDQDERPAAAAAVAVDDDDDEPAAKNPAAVALGKLGGRKGGPARARALSPERRREIARKAAKTRWEKKKSSD